MGRRTLLLITSILVAAVGTALIGLYVRGAESRAIGNTATRSVLVAQTDIPGGSVPGRKSYRLEERRVGDLADQPITDPAQIIGRAVSPIYRGQVLQARMFAAGGAIGAGNGIKAGQLGITVDLTDAQRAAGLLRLGSLIDIFTLPATGNGGRKPGPILSGVTVIQIGNQRMGSTADGADDENVPSTLVGLTLSEPDVIRLKSAEAAGSLYFAVLPKPAS